MSIYNVKNFLKNGVENLEKCGSFIVFLQYSEINYHWQQAITIVGVGIP